MMFKFPEKKIKDKVWFYASRSNLLYGMIQSISISITEQKVAVWYSITDEEGKSHVVNEAQVCTSEKVIQQPKFSVGEEVKYKYVDKEKQVVYSQGVITQVEFNVYNDCNECCYYIDDDNSFWYLEDEIIGYSDSIPEEVSEAQ